MNKRSFAILGAMERRWEDFEVGLRVSSPGVTVTESHVVSWTGLTGDWSSFHVDAQAAARSVFGERVAHGPLTLALALGLVTQTGVFGDAIVAWLGLDEVRVPRPVRIGDTISVDAEVVDTQATSNPDRGRSVLAYRVSNQSGQPVMSFRSAFLLKRRQPSRAAEADGAVRS
jgi:itaconyl-CoA hydratase